MDSTAEQRHEQFLWGGTHKHTPVRRLSAPREKTLTELGLRDTRFVRDDLHYMKQSFDCDRLVCAYHDDPKPELDCE